jgi:hypothetical protein
VRSPSFRKETFKLLVQGFLKVRSADGELPEQDVLAVLDAQRPGTEREVYNELINPHTRSAIARTKSTFTIVYDEESYLARRQRVRGLVSLTEGMWVWARDGLNLDRKRRRWYPGSTSSLLIGPVRCPAYADLWQATPSQKKEFYGTHIVLSGGKCDSDEPRPQTPQGEEPVSFHASDTLFYATLVHDFNIQGVLDATCADEVFALTCARHKVPYVGLCFSEPHRLALKQQLLKRMWQEYQDSSSPMHEPGLAKLLKPEISAAKTKKATSAAVRGTTAGDKSEKEGAVVAPDAVKNDKGKKGKALTADKARETSLERSPVDVSLCFMRAPARPRNT